MAFKEAENPNPLTTDDKFLIEIELNNNEKELNALLKETGAIDITTIEKRAIMNRTTSFGLLVILLLSLQSCFNPRNPTINISQYVRTCRL